MIKILISTCFNIAENDFTLLFDRRDAAKISTMKMFKELKKKERCANSLKIKNDGENVST